MTLADKLKSLRKAKKVSQEKLADYLGISYQAVSKWENGVTSPDITLLPDIARYFGITVDELLQVEPIDEEAYIQECRQKAGELFLNNKFSEMIPIWEDALKKLPNNVEVKEMLMSAYFDTDIAKYQKEIIELGTEIYYSKNNEVLRGYYEGQAISQITRTYYACGNREKAMEWMKKAHQINHCQELLCMMIFDDEERLAKGFAFTNYWSLQNLFHMAGRLNQCNVEYFGKDYVQNVNKAVANVFELVYPNDDMGFGVLYGLCRLHRCIAEDETKLTNDESVVEKHLTRAVECAVKSVNMKAHTLTHPLVYGWEVSDIPSDNMQMVRTLKDELAWECFKEYRNKEWYLKLIDTLESVLKD